jgi:hypothetical protein
MQQRERRRGRVEGLLGQMQHRGRILADGVQHHRSLALGHHLAQDVDAFGLQALQMRQSHGRKILGEMAVNGMRPGCRAVSDGLENDVGG